MTIPRAIYFFFIAAMACLVPFLSVYYDAYGLTGSQIGVLVALPSLITWLAAPSWGALADVTRRHKLILSLSMGGAIISVLALSQAQQFTWLVAGVISYSLFAAPILSLLDNSVMQLLGDRNTSYGKQRVWGSYGWGLAGLIIGRLINQWGLSVIFYAYAALCFVALLINQRFQMPEVSIKNRLEGGLRQLFSNRQWLVFLIIALIIGAGISLVANYYFIFLVSLNTNGTMMGIALALGVLSEIPLLYYSDWILARFNVRWLLLLGAGLMVFRALAASFAVLPWQGVALFFFQGITFSLVWVAGVKYAAEIAPEGLGATAQGVFGGVFMGLGFAIGSFLGGWLYGLIGIRAMYRWDALVMFLTAIAFALWSSRNQIGIAEPAVET